MPYRTPPGTQLVAHRGNSGPFPENTRVAVESAIELGIDMVEVDVRLTSDEVPVLMHTAAVDDTTSGTGLVADLTWEECRSLDAGIWRGRQFAGQHVPSLSEVLELCRGRIAVNIDAKTPAVVESAVAATLEAGMADDVVITGCGIDCVQAVTSIDANVTSLFNLDDLLWGIDPGAAGDVVRHGIEVAKDIGAAGINLHHTLVDADVIVRAIAAGLEVWAFTVDDTTRFGELVDMGAASLTTNWPARMLDFVQTRSPQ